MSLPSGARAITVSTVTFSRPMIRSIHSPLNTPGLPQSKPSSSRNRTVSSRSSTTRPMWTKLVTPGRWLSIEVDRSVAGFPGRGITAGWGGRNTALPKELLLVLEGESERFDAVGVIGRLVVGLHGVAAHATILPCATRNGVVLLVLRIISAETQRGDRATT